MNARIEGGIVRVEALSAYEYKTSFLPSIEGTTCVSFSYHPPPLQNGDLFSPRPSFVIEPSIILDRDGKAQEWYFAVRDIGHEMECGGRTTESVEHRDIIQKFVDRYKQAADDTRFRDPEEADSRSAVGSQLCAVGCLMKNAVESLSTGLEVYAREIAMSTQDEGSSTSESGSYYMSREDYGIHSIDISVDRKDVECLGTNNDDWSKAAAEVRSISDRSNKGKQAAAEEAHGF